MINTPSIGALIRDNKTFRINSDIQTGAKYGMVTLDGFLQAQLDDLRVRVEELEAALATPPAEASSRKKRAAALNTFVSGGQQIAECASRSRRRRVVPLRGMPRITIP